MFRSCMVRYPFKNCQVVEANLDWTTAMWGRNNVFIFVGFQVCKLKHAKQWFQAMMKLIFSDVLYILLFRVHIHPIFSRISSCLWSRFGQLVIDSAGKPSRGIFVWHYIRSLHPVWRKWIWKTAVMLVMRQESDGPHKRHQKRQVLRLSVWSSLCRSPFLVSEAFQGCLTSEWGRLQWNNISSVAKNAKGNSAIDLSGKTNWVWINTYENTIFRGMNIHLPTILMWTTGVQGFDPYPIEGSEVWMVWGMQIPSDSFS